jgi:hypothetical protein
MVDNLVIDHLECCVDFITIGCALSRLAFSYCSRVCDVREENSYVRLRRRAVLSLLAAYCFLSFLACLFERLLRPRHAVIAESEQQRLGRGRHHGRLRPHHLRQKAQLPLVRTLAVCFRLGRSDVSICQRAVTPNAASVVHTKVDGTSTTAVGDGSCDEAVSVG